MTTNPCNTTGLNNLLSSLHGSPNIAARRQAGIANAIALEARSALVSNNIRNPGFASLMTADVLQGMRNRLFLKYNGIDYEFYNTSNLLYRTTLP